MILTHGASSLKVEDDSKVTIGGRDYPVVKIGNQLWITKNLEYVWDGLSVGGESASTSHAWYYSNNKGTYGLDGTYKCGLLYNGYSLEYLISNTSTLLPDGWHVPTRAEYGTLITAVGSNAGTKLKAVNNSVTSNWPSSWNGTDDYGFGALPGGCRTTQFWDVNSYCYLWTSTILGSAYELRRMSSGTSVDTYSSSITDAYSIRLVKNVT